MGRSQKYIYMEKQVGALCGVHAINNLMQGPHFDANALARIGHEMDAREAEVMGYSQGLSNNVDASGNFSIQVLQVALERHSSNITLKVLNKTEVPSKYEGFLCNKSEHWFAIRRIYNIYWNLNSMAERPTRVSDSELAALIAETKAKGYTVHICHTHTPLPDPDEMRKVMPAEFQSRWIALDDAEGGARGAKIDYFAGISGSGNSMKSSTSSGNTSAARGSAAPQSAHTDAHSHVPKKQRHSEESDLERAIRASLEDARTTAQAEIGPEPAAGTGVVAVQLRCQGRAVRRRFRAEDLAVLLWDFCMIEFECATDAKLIEAGTRPPRVLTREVVGTQTMTEAGLAGKSFTIR